MIYRSDVAHAPQVWPLPTNVTDMIRLDEWLASLPILQENAKLALERTDEINYGQNVPVSVHRTDWHCESWTRPVTRDQMEDDPDAVAKAKREIVQALAYTLYGFARVANSICWRIRPEMDVQTDPITCNTIIAVYVRFGAIRETNILPQRAVASRFHVESP